MSRKIEILKQRKNGWKTVTGRYETELHNSLGLVPLHAVGGADVVPDPPKLKVLDRYQKYLKVR